MTRDEKIEESDETREMVSAIIELEAERIWNSERIDRLHEGLGMNDCCPHCGYQPRKGRAK